MVSRPKWGGAQGHQDPGQEASLSLASLSHDMGSEGICPGSLRAHSPG